LELEEGILCDLNRAVQKGRNFQCLALQRLNQDPDGVFIELKYHLAWNIRHRRPVFLPEKEYVDFILKKINSCGNGVGGMARLLWLAPDHLHVYIESDGKKSIETIIREIKPFLTKVLLTNRLRKKEG
jgi:REP element-mobilizing transposase RayT